MLKRFLEIVEIEKSIETIFLKGLEMTEEKGNQEVREASEIETVDDLRECYEDCLDRGNEIGMSAALSRIGRRYR